jgi:predicted dehydrogenase
MLRKLRVGIAGYGVVGKRRFEIIKNHPQLTTVAVCDFHFKDGSWPSSEKTGILSGEGKLSEEINYYHDYRELLQEDLDILFVCLTNDIAAEVTIAGLESGLHVFCEKPPGRNVDEIRNVIYYEKKYPDLKLKYGFNHRYHDSIKDALQLMKKGEFGQLINLRGVYGKSKLITFDQSDWRTQREIAGGGVLLDQGIHLVDLLRLFAGEFTEIHSFICNSFWNFDVEDNAYAMMRTAEGVVALLHSSATEWRHRFRLEIAFERGNIILSGLLSGSKSYGAETLTVVWGNIENDHGDPKEQTTRYNNDPSWRDEIYEFADAIINDKPISNGSSEDALRTMQLVYQIYCADNKWREKYNLSPDAPQKES